MKLQSLFFYSGEDRKGFMAAEPVIPASSWHTQRKWLLPRFRADDVPCVGAIQDGQHFLMLRSWRMEWDNAGMDTSQPAPAALPELIGERLRLRAYRDDDTRAVFELYSDPQVTRYWSHPAWTERRQAEDYIAARKALELPAVHAWAVADRHSDELVGTTTLFSLNGPQRRAEIGYSLLSAHQGKGYASEALRLAIGHAFDIIGLERIEADIDPRNLASCKLVEKLGFKREGLLRQRWRVNGETCDSALYGLLRAEFIR